MDDDEEEELTWRGGRGKNTRSGSMAVIATSSEAGHSTCTRRDNVQFTTSPSTRGEEADPRRQSAPSLAPPPLLLQAQSDPLGLVSFPSDPSSLSVEIRKPAEEIWEEEEDEAREIRMERM